MEQSVVEITREELNSKITDIIISVIAGNTPHRWVSDPKRKIDGYVKRVDVSGRVEEFNRAEFRGYINELGMRRKLEDILNSVYTGEFKRTNQFNKNKCWISYGEIIKKEYKKWVECTNGRMEEEYEYAFYKYLQSFQNKAYEDMIELTIE